MPTTENKLNSLSVLTLLILIIGLSFTSSIAQKSEKIISAGVINGKAINLVKPIYPPVAKAVRSYGTVGVRVIINEKGEIIEANATTGHIFLRPASVSAALKSTFTPITLSGKAIKVSGIILYNFYISDKSYSWLELGYSLNHYLGFDWFLEMLPIGFEKEKHLYQEWLDAHFENRLVKYQTLISSIEEKLNKDKKSLWLFKVGRNLGEIQGTRFKQFEAKSLSANLKELISNSPQSVSEGLIPKIRNVIKLIENPQLNIYEPIKGTKLNQLLLEIEETLPILGI